MCISFYYSYGALTKTYLCDWYKLLFYCHCTACCLSICACRCNYSCSYALCCYCSILRYCCNCFIVAAPAYVLAVCCINWKNCCCKLESISFIHIKRFSAKLYLCYRNLYRLLRLISRFYFIRTNNCFTSVTIKICRIYLRITVAYIKTTNILNRYISSKLLPLAIDKSTYKCNVITCSSSYIYIITIKAQTCVINTLVCYTISPYLSPLFSRVGIVKAV